MRFGASIRNRWHHGLSTLATSRCQRYPRSFSSASISRHDHENAIRHRCCNSAVFGGACRCGKVRTAHSEDTAAFLRHCRNARGVRLHQSCARDVRNGGSFAPPTRRFCHRTGLSAPCRRSGPMPRSGPCQPRAFEPIGISLPDLRAQGIAISARSAAGNASDNQQRRGAACCPIL